MAMPSAAPITMASSSPMAPRYSEGPAFFHRSPSRSRFHPAFATSESEGSRSRETSPNWTINSQAIASRRSGRYFTNVGNGHPREGGGPFLSSRKTGFPPARERQHVALSNSLRLDGFVAHEVPDLVHLFRKHGG